MRSNRSVFAGELEVDEPDVDRQAFERRARFFEVATAR